MSTVFVYLFIFIESKVAQNILVGLIASSPMTPGGCVICYWAYCSLFSDIVFINILSQNQTGFYNGFIFIFTQLLLNLSDPGLECHKQIWIYKIIQLICI